MKTRSVGIFGLSGIGNTILLLTLLFSVVVGAYFTVTAYYTQIGIYADKELAKLKAIAATGATQIDVRDLEYLRQTYPAPDAIRTNDQDSVYARINRILAEIRAVNEMETTLYLLEYDRGYEKFCFLVNSDDSPFWLHPYREFPKELLEQYDRGGVLYPYESENGYWLSAFCPIQSATGETVAILHADQRFELFMMQAREPVFRSILISLAVIVLLTLVLVINVRTQLRKDARMMIQTEKLDILRKELIANVSHDLRTPLSSIRGYLETILLKTQQTERKDLEGYVDVALKSSERLAKLIDELFELSKLEAGDIQAHPVPEDLVGLLRGKVNSFKPSAEAMGVNLILRVPETNVEAMMDVAMIDRVLDNLLDNAIRYTGQGGEVRLIAQAKAGGEKRIVISVEDNGPGIAADDLDLIFKRAYKGNRENSGSGLGLYIARNLVRLHGADLQVESKPGVGTVFRFELTLTG